MGRGILILKQGLMNLTHLHLLLSSIDGGIESVLKRGPPLDQLIIYQSMQGYAIKDALDT